MYLVELRPGKEELYRTGDDLALAIRDGDVDARSRIYHRATAKWISITLHPQYKAIVAGQSGRADDAARSQGVGTLPSRSDGPGSRDVLVGCERRRRKRSSSLEAPHGLGLSGLLLVLGIQLASPVRVHRGPGEAVATIVPAIERRRSEACRDRRVT